MNTTERDKLLADALEFIATWKDTLANYVEAHEWARQFDSEARAILARAAQPVTISGHVTRESSGVVLVDILSESQA